jgi:hypothetical protein
MEKACKRSIDGHLVTIQLIFKWQVNPGKAAAGMMRMKEPIRACCMAVESEETTSPNPTMATVKQNRDRTHDRHGSTHGNGEPVQAPQV